MLPCFARPLPSRVFSNARRNSVCVRSKQDEDDGMSITPVERFIMKHNDEDDFPGVFACYNGDEAIQYIAHSRTVIAAISELKDSVGNDLKAVR